MNNGDTYTFNEKEIVLVMTNKRIITLKDMKNSDKESKSDSNLVTYLE